MTNRLTRGLASASILSLFGLAFAAVAQAEVPSTVDVYTGIAHAAGVHALYYTATLSSFAGSGAIDNRYPLTNIYQDIAPSANARASTEDGGPFAATLYAIGKSPKQFPYAVAQYPATPQAPSDDKCDPSQPNVDHQCPAGSATVHAHELASSADGVFNGNPGSPGQPAFDNATAHTDSVVNPDGSLVIRTHSHVGQATFAGGALVVKNTDVVTSVVSKGGVGKATDTVAPGDVTFENQPVHVTDKEVQVGTVVVPTAGVGTGNGVSSFTFKVYTVSPEMAQQGPHASILATGLHVVVTQNAIAGNQAIPPNSVEYILGEGQADGFAIPASPSSNVSTADLTGFPGGSDLGVVGGAPADTSTTTYPPTDTFNTPSGLVNPVSPTTPKRKSPLAAGVGLASLSRPNLAVMFFAWELLIMATAASMVWGRRAKRAAGLLE
jgi:hypothetical protein